MSSGAPFLEGLLQAAIFAHRLEIGVIVLAGVALALWAWRSGRRRWAALGLLLAVSPILLFVVGRNRAEQRLTERQRQVADGLHGRLPADYPRRLLVLGTFAPPSAAALLVLNQFDSVEVREFDTMATVYGSPRHDAACIAAARAWLFPPADTGKVATTNPARSLANCATASQGAPMLAAGVDAVVLRTDFSATHRTTGRIWDQGAVEIGVRRHGIEQLIDYRERPLEEEQATIASPIRRPIGPSDPLNATALLVAAMPAGSFHRH